MHDGCCEVPQRETTIGPHAQGLQYSGDVLSYAKVEFGGDSMGPRLRRRPHRASRWMTRRKAWRHKHEQNR